MEKSEALRLADLLESCPLTVGDAQQAVAAAELRRQHGEIKSMRAERLRSERRLLDVKAQRDALLEACKAYDKWAHKTLCYDRELRPIRAQIRAAIKAVEENT